MASAGKGAPFKTTWLDSSENQQAIRKSFFAGDQDQALAAPMEDFYFGEEEAAGVPRNRAIDLAIVAESWRAPEWPQQRRPVVTPEFEPCSGADVVQGPFYSGAGTSFQTPPDTRFLFPLSVTIVASTKRLLLVYIAHNGVGSISSVKLSGSPLVQRGVVLNDLIDGAINTAAIQIELWSLTSPGVGTHDLVIETSVAMDLGVQATQCRNVDQGTPLGTVFAAVAGPSAGVSSISVDVLDTIPQSLVVDLVGYNAIPSLSWTAGAGQTSRGNVSFGIANSKQNISDEPAGLGGTVTMSGNTTGSIDAAMAQLAVEVRSCVPPPSFVPFRRALAPVLNSWLLEPGIAPRRLLVPPEVPPVLLPRARRLAMTLESWRPPDPIRERRLSVGPQPVCLRPDSDINTNWGGPYRTLAGIPAAIPHHAAASSPDGTDTWIGVSSGVGTNPQIFRLSGIVNEGTVYRVRATVFTISTPLSPGAVFIVDLVTSAGNRYSSGNFSIAGLTNSPTDIEIFVSTVSGPVGVGTANSMEVGASGGGVPDTGKYIGLTFIEVCLPKPPVTRRWLNAVLDSWNPVDQIRQRRLGVIEVVERVPFSRRWAPAVDQSWQIPDPTQQRRPGIVETPAEKNPFSRYWLNAVADTWLPPDPVAQKRNKQQFEFFPGPIPPPPEEVCYPRVDDPISGFSRDTIGATAYTKEGPVSAYTRDAPPGFTGTRVAGPADTFARMDEPDCGETMGYGEGYGIDYGGT